MLEQTPTEKTGNGTPNTDGARQESTAPEDSALTATRRRRRILVYGACAAIFVPLFVALLWLAIFVPVSRTAEPIAPPRLTFLTRDGQPFAATGPIMDEPVKASQLPAYVPQAFIAIEDRRFRSHWGVDPIGLSRAVVNNALGRGQQGGSTLTQQLAKNCYLRGPNGEFERSYARKIKEALISFWLEAWLTKDEILERYLSNVMFGDGIYGLRAASMHYFYRQPEKLSLEQAVMLAGLVQMPNAYDPRRNLERAQARARMVAAAMVRDGYITQAQANGLTGATLDLRQAKSLKTGTYFADWVRDEAYARAAADVYEQKVVTTLDGDLQRAARRIVEGYAPPGTNAALVAMRPDGEVLAMYGGRDYDTQEFNYAVSGRRQPGSTFKLFTYLTALERGMTAKSTVANTPITEGDWKPANSSGHYSATMTLGDAFAWSSNVAAVRLFKQVGGAAVIDTARKLGVTEPLPPDDPSIALGTADVSLLHMTAAYAAIAAGRYPVTPTGLPPQKKGLLDSLFSSDTKAIDGAALEQMRTLMAGVVERGTGHSARLPVKAYGKTGTSQNNRDAWFIGYAGELVVGVWIGRDGDGSTWGMSGGAIPARVWHDFMVYAIRTGKLSSKEAISLDELDDAKTEATPAASASDATGSAAQDDGLVIDGAQGPTNDTAPNPGTFIGDDGRVIDIGGGPAAAGPGSAPSGAASTAPNPAQSPLPAPGAPATVAAPG